MHGVPLNFGIALTWVTLVCALGASACALLWGQGKTRLAQPTRVLYGLQVAGLLTLAAWLVHLFLSHDFRYAYIANYSSRAMETRYVFAAFWGGQEGTFLLWALWSTLLSALLFRVRSRIAPTAVFFANWAPVFLLLILTAQSPFRLLPKAALDGAGLNPLLQDYWMTIHPPTLFLGYSSLILPFALALSTLVHRDEAAWIKTAPPFVLLSTVILGTGFTMGGLWAYKVLGWGGFWGWDPVENASLVPWLFNIALLHGLLVQRATGALGRTTLFLGITSYLFVLYGSFLTRSGVLADFSVHSFVDLGLSGYLLTFLGVFAVVGYGMWALRSSTFSRPTAQLAAWSREFALWLGMLTFCLMAILTMAGTSAPLLSKLFTGTAGNVQTAYYNAVNGPLGLLVCLLVAIGPMVRWRQEAPGRLLQQAMPSLVFGVVVAGAAFAFGMRAPMLLALVFGAGFALLSNLTITLKAAQRGLPYAAGYVSHLGLAVLLVGVLSYSTFGRDRQVSLPKGKTVEAIGFSMRYDGVLPQPDGKDKLAIAVTGEGRSFEAQPVLYFSEFNQGVMRNPHVERFWSHDVYISPIELKTPEEGGSTTLAKGESGSASGMPLTFEDFEREGVMGDPNGFTIRARVRVGSGASAAVVRPGIRVEPKYGMTKLPADLPGGGAISLGTLNPNTGTAQFLVEAPVGAGGVAPVNPEVLAVEISTKPLIGLVWIGMGILLFGAVLGIVRRLALQARARTAPVPAGARAVAAP
ncbi:MAG: cytochrome c biogenesis protein CcsA [Candidatus Eisenbacteria bacterium]